MAVRLQLVPGREPPDLIDLPWSTPLQLWDHPRLVRMARGVSRHVVRFVADGDRVYALKETAPADGRREYGLLRQLAEEKVPVVEAVGLADRRQDADGGALGSILVTRYLDYSLPFRYLFGVEGGPGLAHKLVDAAVVLLVRIHADGFFWGDCSLSNLLFRRDAGSLMAYLVDAETAERHPAPLPDRLRQADVDLAAENLGGGLFDLEAEGLLAADIDVAGLSGALVTRYGQLWDELTRTLEVDLSERHLIDRRLRRLNELGFDIAELVVEHDSGADRLRVTPALVEEGHHSRRLRSLTGLEVQENQARRLLNDVAAFGAHLHRAGGRALPPAVVAARWIAEVYEPLAEAIPPELRGRREPAELLHELLEHRYYLSEAAGHEVDNAAAMASYVASVLTHRPDERVILDDPAPPGPT